MSFDCDNFILVRVELQICTLTNNQGLESWVLQVFQDTEENFSTFYELNAQTIYYKHNTTHTAFLYKIFHTT